MALYEITLWGVSRKFFCGEMQGLADVGIYRMKAKEKTIENDA